MTRKDLRGFTMIEMIGVLAIMAILLSILAPNIARQITRATADAEDESLAVLSKSLRAEIRRTRVIPSTDTLAAGSWNQVLAGTLDLPATGLINNVRSGKRRLVSRPTMTPALPYNQQTAFSTGAGFLGTLPTLAPADPRFLWVSNLDGASPAALTVAADFDNAWNQTLPPAGYLENDNLRLGRLNLRDMFHQVTLNVLATPASAGWSIDAAATKTATIPAAFTVFLLEGTQINLFAGATAMGRVMITGPATFTFDGTSWSW